MLKQRAGPQFDVGTSTFDNEETCLHLAVSNGKREMVRYLLEEYPQMAN
jgi:ankyrin repeat protein